MRGRPDVKLPKYRIMSNLLSTVSVVDWPAGEVEGPPAPCPGPVSRGGCCTPKIFAEKIHFFVLFMLYTEPSIETTIIKGHRLL